MNWVSSRAPHVVITGPMGVGKSTSGSLLGSALGRDVRDSDRDIERTFGVTGGEIAARDGVPVLHHLEAGMLIGALAANVPLVICAAASVVTDPSCRDALARRAFTVILDAPIDELVVRSRTGGHRRPMTAEMYTAYMAERGPLFEAVADITLDATQPVERVVELALAELSERYPAVR